MTEERIELVKLTRHLARLLHRRSSTPRGEALGLAHRAIRIYADRHGLGEDFCDKVMLLFLSGRHDILETAA